MLQRRHYLNTIKNDIAKSRAVALLGPRQCGKTTLAHEILRELSHPNHFFDLENPEHLNALEQAKLTLEPLNGLIVIDEIQRRPNLFPLMRYLIDSQNKKFFILGSASQALLKQSAESLAGRIRYREITPFSLSETYPIYKNWHRLWFRGGFPLSYLESGDLDAQAWLKDYIRTFLEIDIPSLGIDLNPEKIRRFWMMLTHYHAQIFNASEISRSINASYKTAQHYIDILHHTFMIRILQPWHINIGKRQVKQPKIYFRDSGIFHTLLGIPDLEHLLLSPKIGASFEGFALEELIRFHQADSQDCYFWSTHSGAELDLLLFPYTKKLAFEIKYTSTPKITKSMHQAIHDLGLEKLFIIIPGDAHYPLAENIWVYGLNKYLQLTP